MGKINVDEKGKIRCYPFGRKGYAKRNAAKAARRINKKVCKENK